MKSETGAFSRVDLLMCLCAVSFICLLASSLVASNKSESQRVICFNNLRQIGRAFHVRGNDFGDPVPWQVYWPGGSRNVPGGVGGAPVSAWWQFTWISNQLGSPKFLACPADSGITRIASEWGFSLQGGFQNPAYRNNSLSYPLFLHAQANAPASLLSGDRNFRADVINQTCSFVGQPVFALQPNGRGAWTNAVHGLTGHLLLMDGSVRFTSSSEFHEAVSSPSEGDGGALHGLSIR